MSTSPRDRVHELGRARPGLLSEYWGFVRENQKWWLLPIVIVTLVLGLLVLVAGTGAAPFIYTLF